MPSTVNANKLTVVHAGSSGVAFSFPDVCKTPTPAGPVPIPYPNIAQSADTAEGSSTVKVDGNPIMLKNSNFGLSTGDEAGSAMGFKSSKIKGKAKPGNASFDVKVDGKCVFRLTDPMLSNGPAENAVAPLECQSPLPEGVAESKECQRVKEKGKRQSEEHTAKRSGMRPEHFAAIKQVAKEFKVIMYFRQTESVCAKWIDRKHQPKPHIVFLANTIKKSNLKEVENFLRKHEKSLAAGGRIPRGKKVGLFLSDAGKQSVSEIGIRDDVNLDESNEAYSSRARDFLGVIGEVCGVDENRNRMRRPLQAVYIGRQVGGGTYLNRWLTADYDVYQILYARDGCEKVQQGPGDWIKIKRAINKRCHWDAIQHGPQAQWISAAEDVALGAPENINFPQEIRSGMESGKAQKKIAIPNRKAMKVFDDKITIIAPAGVVFLGEQQDTWDALKCRECDKQ
jgi:hypothetical protein